MVALQVYIQSKVVLIEKVCMNRERLLEHRKNLLQRKGFMIRKDCVNGERKLKERLYQQCRNKAKVAQIKRCCLNKENCINKEKLQRHRLRNKDGQQYSTRIINFFKGMIASDSNLQCVQQSDNMALKNILKLFSDLILIIYN